MRYLLTLSLIVFSFLFASAVNNGGCGTVAPANYQLNTSDAERSSFISTASRGGIRYVPVTYHVVTKTNGTGGASLKTVFDTHCELNTDFAPSQMYFYIYSIVEINDDALWGMSDGQGGTNYNLGYGAYSTYNETNVVNVYITGELPGLCGFATFPGSAPNGGGLFLNEGCCGVGGRTIGHEMGHFFNLDHTFRSTNPVEYVDGSNCATKGDRFCDTPADFLDERTACPYNGTQTDPHGDLYSTVIDETLIMSYFSDNCVYRFSNQQQNEMNATLTSDRPGLLTQPVPSVTPLDSAEFITPVSGDSTAIGSSISFKWHAVPGAQYYLFHLQPASSSIVLVDTVTTDTAFNFGGLQANKSYKFYVKPISFGNVCESASPYHYVQTSLIKATITVVTPSCPGQANAVIGVSPSNGVPPYTVTWSNSQTGTTLSNVSPGNYTVTITDNNGAVATATIVVNDPSPVTVSINKVGNNLNAYGDGGTPPYTYSWSNGINGQFNNNVPFGNYTVTVTDSKGCTTTESFVISSIGVNYDTKVAMKVFPNPASKVSSLNLQVTLNESTEATVLLMNVNGEVVMNLKKEFTTGINNTFVNIDQLPSGVYFLQFRSNEAVKTERISVIR